MNDRIIKGYDKFECRDFRIADNFHDTIYF